MRLFADVNVNNPEELRNRFGNPLENDAKVPPKFDIAIEGLIFDKSLNLILHERGPGSRDEIGKLEGIGGVFYEDDDKDFQSALYRKFREKLGTDVDIKIVRFFEVRRDMAISQTGNKGIWIIISFICLLSSGEPRIQQPERTIRFVGLSFERIQDILNSGKPKDTVSSSTASAFRSLVIEWDIIKKEINETIQKLTE